MITATRARQIAKQPSRLINAHGFKYEMEQIDRKVKSASGLGIRYVICAYRGDNQESLNNELVDLGYKIEWGGLGEDKLLFIKW